MVVHIFVQTDIKYNELYEIYSELNVNKQLYNTGVKTVTNGGICNKNGKQEWSSFYHFARTAAVVLRAFFVRGMNFDSNSHYVDPFAPSVPTNLQSIREHSIFHNSENTESQTGASFQFPNLLSVNEDEAKCVTNMFDQMMVHALIQDACRRSMSHIGGLFERGCLLIHRRQDTADTWKIYNVKVKLTWQVASSAPGYSQARRLRDPKGHVMVEGGQLLPSATSCCPTFDYFLKRVDGCLGPTKPSSCRDDDTQTMESLFQSLNVSGTSINCSGNSNEIINEEENEFIEETPLIV